MHDLGWFSDAKLAKVRVALMLSNDERDLLKALVQHASEAVAQWGAAVSWPVARRKRFLCATWYESLKALLSALRPAVAQAMEADREELGRTRPGLKPVPYVNGEVLMGAGMRPGPVFREILDAVYDAQLEDRISGVEEGLALARELWTRGGGVEKNLRGTGNPGRPTGS
jgi:hypothetical protein